VDDDVGGFDVGLGEDVVPHPFRRLAFRAWTSTSCLLPGQTVALCGWLLPGPCRFVPEGAPFVLAICDAVFPFPYRFDASPAPIVVAFAPLEVQPLAVVVQFVSFAVAVVGFTPVVVAEFCAALPPPDPCVVDWVEAAAFFSCPGAFSEFPGAAVELWEADADAGAAGAVASAWPFALPLPFPLPLPARAEPVNAAMPSTSTTVPMRLAKRFVISFSPRLEQPF